ncbi:baseplate hub protein [Francisella tularensis]|uniref:baseplate hub protein n=1 Tax=Francisella tularensis TaxID=263 RepID=UPI0008F4D631|nr:hypothetical protein [Francisella tularensis]APA83245.1 hypothetical protein N894_1261 [Francisella tularensis subsp. novicida PA10-7858]
MLYANNLKIRCIKVELTLEKGRFPDIAGSATKVVIGYSIPNSLHISANLKEEMNVYGNTASICIFGMKREDCEVLTRYNSFGLQYYHAIKVYAGYLDVGNDDYKSVEKILQQKGDNKYTNNLPLVYSGNIAIAMMDMNDKNRPFYITANSMGKTTYSILKPVTINNEKDIKELAREIVEEYNQKNNDDFQIVFDDYGGFVSKKVSNLHYESDTALSQLKKLLEDNDYNFRIKNKVIYVSQLLSNHSSRSNSLTLNKDNGMIGYPVVDSLYFKAKMYYNHNFNAGRKIILDTTYRALNNKDNNIEYRIFAINSILETNGPMWESELIIQPQQIQYSEENIDVK